MLSLGTLPQVLAVRHAAGNNGGVILFVWDGTDALPHPPECAVCVLNALHISSAGLNQCILKASTTIEEAAV